MLTNEIVKKVEEFVSVKPRSVQEIAQHLGKNWRTADRYIEEIEKEYGTLSTRTFRGGTRGALKIVFWASPDKARNSVFQQQLEDAILKGRTKYDFSAFDVYQYINHNKKSARMFTGASEEFSDIAGLKNMLRGVEKQLLIFSGNLSFINIKYPEIFDIMDKLVKEGVSIKIISRVDMAGRENIEKMLSLNSKYGKELVEIHHREQPLRANIYDNKFFSMKEIQEPTGRKGELKDKTWIFYEIREKIWAEWLSRIFWKMFSSSIDASKRLEELNQLASSSNSAI